MEWDGKQVVYVLALKNGKYYVGSTSHLSTRLAAHDNATGSAWTSLYPPVRVMDVFEGNAFAETVKTKEMMEEYGIENVRGGPWCTQSIDPATVAALEHEFRAAHGSCYGCGQPGHMIRDCTSPRRYTLSPRSNTNQIASALWTTLDKGFGDSVDGLKVVFSGQRDGRLDHLVKEGALYSYRKTSQDEWTIGGVVDKVECLLPKESPCKFELTLKPIPQSSTSLRGKSAVLREVGAPVPKWDKWEMSGITAL